MNYHTELIDKYLQKGEELRWSGSPVSYKDNLTRITITYLGFVLVIAGIVAWFYPEKAFTYALGIGLLGMVTVFIWAFFMIKKQAQNKADTEDIIYAITDSRIFICSMSMKKMIKEYHFAAITHAFIENWSENCGTVYFEPNANTPYRSSKLSNLILYTTFELDSSRLLYISRPEKVCDLINQTVEDYEQRMKSKKKK